jgi:hypothetical protein
MLNVVLAEYVVEEVQRRERIAMALAGVQLGLVHI